MGYGWSYDSSISLETNYLLNSSFKIKIIMSTKSILEEILNLRWYNNVAQSKEILKRLMSSLTSLEINRTLVGHLNFPAPTQVDLGNSFVVGNVYSALVASGDDFSNIGYVEDNTPFRATGTTPLVWEDEESSAIYFKEESTILFNDVSPVISIKYNMPDISKFEIKINNNGFVADKTYLNFNDIVGVSLVDTNTITIPLSSGVVNFFKVEVYN